MPKYSYYNRDLSWLSFNYRVLQEAKDETNPLYERIKFLAIYSNNLEEFYQVRVSYYRQLIENDRFIPEGFGEKNPAKIIRKINERVSKYQAEFHEIFNKHIVPELRKNGIFLLEKGAKLTESQLKFLENVFDSEVLSTIQPILLIKDKIYPFLKTGQVYIALEMYNKEPVNRPIENKRAKYGLIKLPTDHNISRFVTLPEEDGRYSIIFLDDMIMHFVHKIFPGYIVKDWHSIK